MGFTAGYSRAAVAANDQAVLGQSMHLHLVPRSLLELGTAVRFSGGEGGAERAQRVCSSASIRLAGNIVSVPVHLFKVGRFLDGDRNDFSSARDLAAGVVGDCRRCTFAV